MPYLHDGIGKKNTPFYGINVVNLEKTLHRLALLVGRQLHELDWGSGQEGGGGAAGEGEDLHRGGPGGDSEPVEIGEEQRRDDGDPARGVRVRVGEGKLEVHLGGRAGGGRVLVSKGYLKTKNY